MTKEIEKELFDHYQSSRKKLTDFVKEEIEKTPPVLLFGAFAWTTVALCHFINDTTNASLNLIEMMDKANEDYKAFQKEDAA